MSDQKTAGVIAEPWKIPTFRAHLTEAGFEFEELPDPDPKGYTVLKVKFTVDQLQKLRATLFKAQADAATKLPPNLSEGTLQ